MQRKGRSPTYSVSLPKYTLTYGFQQQTTDRVGRPRLIHIPNRWSLQLKKLHGLLASTGPATDVPRQQTGKRARASACRMTESMANFMSPALARHGCGCSSNFNLFVLLCLPLVFFSPHPLSPPPSLSLGPPFFF